MTDWQRYTLRYELFSCLNFDQVTDRCKAMHMSPPCMSTGVLKMWSNKKSVSDQSQKTDRQKNASNGEEPIARCAPHRLAQKLG